MDWSALYEDDTFDSFDPFDDLVPERDHDVEPTPIEHRAMTTFRSGSRVSGMAFSPGGDVSMVHLRQAAAGAAQRQAAHGADLGRRGVDAWRARHAA